MARCKDRNIVIIYRRRKDMTHNAHCEFLISMETETYSLIVSVQQNSHGSKPGCISSYNIE